MTSLLLDTQAIVWFLFDLPRLSTRADQAITTCAQTGTLFISSIPLVELNYLVGKKTFPYPDVLKLLLKLNADPDEPLDVLPLTVEVAEALDRVPRDEVPDMPDRIIAATALAR